GPVRAHRRTARADNDAHRAVDPVRGSAGRAARRHAPARDALARLASGLTRAVTRTVARPEILGGVAARMSSSQLIGRTAELASLTAALARARDETAQIVLVGGEAGVGKSRLVAEFVGALPRHARVLTGYCLELRQAVLAFAPLVGI